MNTVEGGTRSSDSNWRLDPPYGPRSVVMVILILLALIYTGRHVEMGRMLSLTSDGVLAAVGLKADSQVSAGISRIATSLFPIQLSERREVSRIEGFDRDHLPLFARIETLDVSEQRLDPTTLKMVTGVERTDYLVEPLGYLRHVVIKMLETIEIALWGTVLAILLSAPLACFAAKNYTPNRITYSLARGVISLCRAIPELISALFLVLAYGFGPIAGVLALGIHGSGFLGKFYAEDIENADDRPQEALRAIGSRKVSILRFAVLPQVLPQYIAYTVYILDRNVRMATVIGLVGAGGIGQELKGRYDMYNYSHVGTILVAIFLTVYLLDRISARLRSRLI